MTRASSARLLRAPVSLVSLLHPLPLIGGAQEHGVMEVYDFSELRRQVVVKRAAGQRG